MTAIKALSHRTYIAVADSEAQLTVSTLQYAGHILILLSLSTGMVSNSPIS